jgi:hypothetical protein
MTYTLTPEQYQATLALDAEQRYDHFMQQVAENKEVWILKDDEGCMLLTAEDDECIPVWPHPDYAKAWAIDDWSNSHPFAIPLQVWFDRWVKGMAEDGVAVAVFPLQEEAGVIEEPADMAESLQKKITKLARKK